MREAASKRDGHRLGLAVDAAVDGGGQADSLLDLEVECERVLGESGAKQELVAPEAQTAA